MKESMGGQLISVSDLCARWQKPASFIYDLVHRRKIPFIKLGARTLRFSPQAIQEFENAKLVEAEN